MMSVQIPRAHIIRVFVTHVNRRSLCTNRVSIGQLFESTETTFPFAESRTGNFFQTRPVLGNQYLEDCTLQSYLKRHLPNNIFLKVEEDLTRFGLRVSTEIRDLGHQCEQEQPYIQHYDAWGKRVDRLVTCPSWKRLHDISAEEGIIATAYEGENGEFSRLYQMAKVYLFAPVSGLYSCPIAMTDGAAKIIQTLRNLYPWLKERAFYHLTSRKPEEFWTSGQWMTERQGGSDVGGVGTGDEERGEFEDGDQQDDEQERPGFWMCENKCGYNFAWRYTCYWCNAHRPEGADSSKGGLFGGVQVSKLERPGNWTCTESGCGYENFAWRENCNVCDAPRPEGAGGRREERPGDWTCTANGCGYENFAWRDSCKFCDAPRPEGIGGRGEERPGDWTCTANGCRYKNFAWRDSCKFCDAPRPEGAGGRRRGYFGGAQDDELERLGDWTCTENGCGYKNFAWRHSCKVCTAPRPEGAGGRREGYFGGAQVELERLGDWTCTENGCGYKNFAWRHSCKVCTAPRPEGAGGRREANGTETLAVPKSDGSYKLYGYKWFSSATDADMAFTLARVVDSQGNTIQGTRGLSLFYLEVKDQDGNLNNVRIQKLKNKLGTRQLPTAELLLHGTTAYKVSEEGRGVAGISNMLTLTRIHNAVAASGAMRSMCNLARDYSTRRQAFGNTLKNYPLHIQTLCRMEVETRVATLLTMEGARLLGREDVGTASENDQMLLRLLTPLTKLYTAKQAMTVVSEGLESFGGQGYIEDTGLPGTLRDAQVLPIWEGTTNILSLDVLRAIAKTQGAALKVWQSDILTRISRSRDVTDLQACTQQVEQSANRIMAFVSKNQDVLETAARDFAYSLTKTFAGALLIEHAFEAGMNKTDVYTAQRWCNQDLCPVVTNHRNQHYSTCSTDLDLRLVFDGYHDQSQL